MKVVKFCKVFGFLMQSFVVSSLVILFSLLPTFVLAEYRIPALLEEEGLNQRYSSEISRDISADFKIMSETSAMCPAWLESGRDLLHRIAGDDPRAFLGFMPNLRIVSMHQPNAFANYPDEIVVSTGLLSLVQNYSELAFVIAHELAHLQLHSLHQQELHTQGQHRHLGNDFGSYLEHEQQADQLAIAFMKEVGFNPKASLSLLNRMYGFGPKSATLGMQFPSLGLRLEALDVAGDLNGIYSDL